MKSILSDPSILSGMPVVMGTRVPVARILSLVQEGYTLTEIHEQFDHVSIQKLEQVIAEVATQMSRKTYDSQTS